MWISPLKSAINIIFWEKAQLASVQRLSRLQVELRMLGLVVVQVWLETGRNTRSQDTI